MFANAGNMEYKEDRREVCAVVVWWGGGQGFQKLCRNVLFLLGFRKFHTCLDLLVYMGGEGSSLR